MGVTRQKWSSEEEAALKAGVVKHGVGKWSKILKDPEFMMLVVMLICLFIPFTYNNVLNKCWTLKCGSQCLVMWVG